MTQVRSWTFWIRFKNEINMANHTDLEIAVIGMAGRFPGAGDIRDFLA